MKKKKKKSCSREECLSVFLLRLFLPFIFSPVSVNAEVFIAYFQSGVFIVQIPAQVSIAQHLPKNAVIVFLNYKPAAAVCWVHCVKNCTATVLRVHITVSKYPELHAICCVLLFTCPEF